MLSALISASRSPHFCKYIGGSRLRIWVEVAGLYVSVRLSRNAYSLAAKRECLNERFLSTPSSTKDLSLQSYTTWWWACLSPSEPFHLQRLKVFMQCWKLHWFLHSCRHEDHWRWPVLVHAQSSWQSCWIYPVALWSNNSAAFVRSSFCIPCEDAYDKWFKREWWQQRCGVLQYLWLRTAKVLPSATREDHFLESRKPRRWIPGTRFLIEGLQPRRAKTPIEQKRWSSTSSAKRSTQLSGSGGCLTSASHHSASGMPVVATSSSPA